MTLFLNLKRQFDLCFQNLIIFYQQSNFNWLNNVILNYLNGITFRNAYREK